MHSQSPCSATRVAVIDVGTNTIRLLIGCSSNSEVIRIYTDREITRLGKNLHATGRIDEESFNKSVDYLAIIKELCERYAVRRIAAIGTSALREAANGADFIDEVRRHTGIPIEIISGEREADLTIKGVLGPGGCVREPSPVVIIDIGGGSTEWIYCNRKVQAIKSVPVGVVKLLERFIIHDPPTPDELTSLKNFIQEQFSSVALDMQDTKGLKLIATGGTATTLAAIDLRLGQYDGDKVHGHLLSISSVEKLFSKLVILPASQRATIPGVEKERADVILPGTLLMLTLMEMLHLDTITVSDYGLLEGLLREIAEQMQ